MKDFPNKASSPTGEGKPPAVTVAWASAAAPAEVLERMGSRESGLSSEEARVRLEAWGENAIATERRRPWYGRLWNNTKDPLSVLLLILGIVSVITGDLKAAAVIGVMLVMSVSLRSLQEARADAAAERLKAMVRTMAAVVRDGEKVEVPLSCLVPGDIVHLNAGDMVPADIRLLSSRDLFVNQATLTGESLPVEKHAEAPADRPEGDFDLVNACFMGTSVGSGTALGVVLSTGGQTRFGTLAAHLAASAGTDQLRPGYRPLYLADGPVRRGDGTGGLPDQRAEPG